jgi:DNA-directed RNA polymerase subunit RPC12/RpoP
MEKHILEKYINQNLSLNQIGKKTGKSLTTIRYWAKRHNLKSKFKSFHNNPTEYGEFRFCNRCQKQVPTKDFYSRRRKPNSSVYCKTCSNEQAITRQRAIKSKMIEYKGGKCERCGYDKCQAALEFHHKDPSKKDFTIAHAKQRSFNDEIKQELDKCILVCSNCHREVHEEINTNKYIK